jgi:hypothetical protein
LLWYPAGSFYVRAYDNSSSFKLLGAMIMERAKDISEQRDPISHEHPNRERSKSVRQVLRAAAKL